MAVRRGTFESRDFTADPGTSWVVDVPAGHTIAEITVINCGLSASDSINFRVSSGGTPVSLANRVFVGVTTTSSVVDQAAPTTAALTHLGTSGMYGTAQVWNLNTAAPVTMFQEHFMSPWQSRAAVWKSVTPYDQIYIDAGGKTINAGDIYVQLYERSNVVVVQDFTADPLTDWELPNLKKKFDNAIVLSAHDLTLSASEAMSSRISTDGVSFDSGASDYLNGFAFDTNDNAALINHAPLEQSSGTAQGLCSLILGLTAECRTLWQTNDMRVVVNNAALSMTNRETRQVEKALQISADGGETIDGGTGYAVKYAL